METQTTISRNRGAGSEDSVNSNPNYVELCSNTSIVDDSSNLFYGRSSRNFYSNIDEDDGEYDLFSPIVTCHDLIRQQDDANETFYFDFDILEFLDLVESQKRRMADYLVESAGFESLNPSTNTYSTQSGGASYQFNVDMNESDTGSWNRKATLTGTSNVLGESVFPKQAHESLPHRVSLEERIIQSKRKHNTGTYTGNPLASLRRIVRSIIPRKSYSRGKR